MAVKGKLEGLLLTKAFTPFFVFLGPKRESSNLSLKGILRNYHHNERSKKKDSHDDHMLEISASVGRFPRGRATLSCFADFLNGSYEDRNMNTYPRQETKESESFPRQPGAKLGGAGEISSGL